MFPPPQLIDLFSQLGADGLLVEYEDMFPYEGELKLLQATAQPAYRCSLGCKHRILFISSLNVFMGLCVLFYQTNHVVGSCNKTVILPVWDKDNTLSAIKMPWFSKFNEFYLFTVCSVCSRKEVLSMQEVAKCKGMEVIPLVQTFGHMEVRQTSHSPAVHYY